MPALMESLIRVLINQTFHSVVVDLSYLGRAGRGRGNPIKQKKCVMVCIALTAPSSILGDLKLESLAQE